LCYVHPARGNTKNGTTGVSARIMMRRRTDGPEKRDVPAKTDGWQPYTPLDLQAVTPVYLDHVKENKS